MGLFGASARLCVGHGEGEDRLIRVDMSEYGGPGAAERLLGGEGEEVASVEKGEAKPRTSCSSIG